MAPKTQATALNTEQVQLLCQVVQHSEPPKKETWDLIARNLNITNGNAAQQRFGRLLKTLKSADPTSNADGGTPKSKATGKRAAPGKQNGTKLKNGKANTKCTEEDEDDETEDWLDEEETPTKKHKSEKMMGNGTWKSIFGPGDAVKTEDGEDHENGAVPTKVENLEN